MSRVIYSKKYPKFDIEETGKELGQYRTKRKNKSHHGQNVAHGVQIPHEIAQRAH